MTEQCKQRLREQVPNLSDYDISWLRQLCEAAMIERDLEWENVPIGKVEEVLRA